MPNPTQVFPGLVSLLLPSGQVVLAQVADDSDAVVRSTPVRSTLVKLA